MTATSKVRQTKEELPPGIELKVIKAIEMAQETPVVNAGRAEGKVGEAIHLPITVKAGEIAELSKAINEDTDGNEDPHIISGYKILGPINSNAQAEVTAVNDTKSVADDIRKDVDLLEPVRAQQYTKTTVATIQNIDEPAYSQEPLASGQDSDVLENNISNLNDEFYAGLVQSPIQDDVASAAVIEVANTYYTDVDSDVPVDLDDDSDILDIDEVDPLADSNDRTDTIEGSGNETSWQIVLVRQAERTASLIKSFGLNITGAESGVYARCSELERYELNTEGGQARIQKVKQALLSRLDIQEDSATKKSLCAVVGNSGNLMQSKYGSLIDRHDIVIRINAAPVGGKYASQVCCPGNHIPTSSAD